MTDTQVVRFDYGRPGVTHLAELEPATQLFLQNLPVYRVLCMGLFVNLSRWPGPVTCKTCLRLLAKREVAT